MGIFEILLLAVGLAMDAFAVSICKGLAVKKLSIKEILICGIWFGSFQGLMPFIGFLLGSGFEKWIRIVAPWVAFILLTLIGVNMIREAFSEEEEETSAGLDVKTMFIMAVATSIDALAVGITFVAIPVQILDMGKIANTALASGIIAVVTFLISCIGVKIGNLFGTRYKAGSEVMGGTILVFIGLNTLLDALDTSGAMNNSDVIFGMLIPLVGTVAGAAFVYAKKPLTDSFRTVMAGASAGIMFSISVWGMIEPAIGSLDGHGIREIGPIIGFFCLGVVLLYVLDHVVPHTHAFVEITEGPESGLKTETKMMLAELIHHVPEGIALGAVYAAHFMKTEWISVSMALILAVAIAVQNFPEALFVSLPAREKGTGVGKAFFFGVVSGVTVPLLAVITLLALLLFPAVMPYVMAMAGGAIIFTTVEEMPLMTAGKENDTGAISFVICFALMMLMIFAG
ncbi:MAG: manganese efflux pump [Lachnospiraceae bacterium]|nr:manganese efflux pump [Lachnospiraceae bacterium]